MLRVFLLCFYFLPPPPPLSLYLSDFSLCLPNILYNLCCLLKIILNKFWSKFAVCVMYSEPCLQPSAGAVIEAFIRLHEKGLIYQGRGLSYIWTFFSQYYYHDLVLETTFLSWCFGFSLSLLFSSLLALVWERMRLLLLVSKQLHYLSCLLFPGIQSVWWCHMYLSLWGIKKFCDD